MQPFFGQTSETGQIFQIQFSSSKCTAKLISSGVLKLFMKMTENFSFVSKKCLPKKEAKNYSESYFFSTCLKWVKS